MPFAPTEYNPQGTHERIALTGTSPRWLEKAETRATVLVIQAETQNIRYRLDSLRTTYNTTAAPTPTTGFQLIAGQRVSIPSVVGGVAVCAETAGAIIQIQWIT